MCQIVIINEGEKEIESPREFEKHFGFYPPISFGYNEIDLDCCLCQVEVEKGLSLHNIDFEKDCGDIYVTEPKEESKDVCECIMPKPSAFPDGKFYCLNCFNIYYR